MRLNAPGAALRMEALPLAPLRPHEVLIEVSACGVSRTDLHLLDGELPQAVLPVTPGHEIVGRIVDAGHAVDRFCSGDIAVEPPAINPGAVKAAREKLMQLGTEMRNRNIG